MSIHLYVKKLLTFMITFGEITSKKAITILFYIGIIPILIQSYVIGNTIHLTYTYQKQISYLSNGIPRFTSVETPNIFFGILSGILAFIATLFIWKIICELLIMIFRCFETYARSNTSAK